MSKLLKIGVLLAVGLAIVIAVSLFSLYEASQQVPAFYHAALVGDPETQQVARDEFVAETTALASDLRRQGRWQHLFTADQINAWLALELVANYPQMLGGQLHDPRVEIGEHQATIACRYESGSMSTVLSLTIEPYLQEPNVLALRIRRARAGALPVPLAQVLDTISTAARQLKLRLEWRKSHGDPVALVTFPQARDSQTPALQLQAVELRKGELLVVGALGKARVINLADAEDPPSDEQPQPAADEDHPLIGSAAKDTRQE